MSAEAGDKKPEKPQLRKERTKPDSLRKSTSIKTETCRQKYFSRKAQARFKACLDQTQNTRANG